MVSRIYGLEQPESYLRMHKRFKTRPDGEASFYRGNFDLRLKVLPILVKHTLPYVFYNILHVQSIITVHLGALDTHVVLMVAPS